MKKFLVLALIIGITTLSFIISTKYKSNTGNFLGEIEEERLTYNKWNQWKKDFDRSYSLDEELHRYNVFKKNKKFIEENNEKFEKKETTVKLGLNKFADITNEEFTNLYLNNKQVKKKFFLINKK